MGDGRRCVLDRLLASRRRSMHDFPHLGSLPDASGATSRGTRSIPEFILSKFRPQGFRILGILGIRKFRKFRVLARTLSFLTPGFDPDSARNDCRL